jgi:hypothetical protein
MHKKCRYILYNSFFIGRRLFKIKILENPQQKSCKSAKYRLETLENSLPILSPLKPIKNKVKREVVQFYIARRAAVKNAAYCNRI